MILNSPTISVVVILTSMTLSSMAADEDRTKRQILTVSPSDDLPRIVNAAKPGTTILLKNGIYKLGRALVFHQQNVWIGSESGERHQVILDGKKGDGKLLRANCVNEIISVKASDVKITDISICHARDHGIHISPANNGHIRNVVMRNIHVYDCGQQLIKVNSNGRKPPFWTDDCILEDSLIEFKDNSIMHNMGSHFYTGGLDVHGGKNWIIRRNTFRNIQRDGKLMEHAVHMWSKCRGTVIEQNRFINCYRAIGLGMKVKPTGLVREYPDENKATPYYDHLGGLIRNNFIFNRKGIHLESGIELMNVLNTKVYQNTVVSQDKPFSSIEYRWPNTRVEIFNNIVSHKIMKRNNAFALLKGNIENAPGSLFVDYKSGDLHLSPKAVQAIGKAALSKATATSFDIDGDKRDAQPDIGADEFRPSR